MVYGGECFILFCRKRLSSRTMCTVGNGGAYESSVSNCFLQRVAMIAVLHRYTGLGCGQAVLVDLPQVIAHAVEQPLEAELGGGGLVHMDLEEEFILFLGAVAVGDVGVGIVRDPWLTADLRTAEGTGEAL